VTDDDTKTGPASGTAAAWSKRIAYTRVSATKVGWRARR